MERYLLFQYVFYHEESTGAVTVSDCKREGVA